jgi:hypothetical protein
MRRTGCCESAHSHRWFDPEHRATESTSER